MRLKEISKVSRQCGGAWLADGIEFAAGSSERCVLMFVHQKRELGWLIETAVYSNVVLFDEEN